MSSIGETLRRERLRRNLDLDQISRELKISSRFLEAIEEDRFDRLPAGVFAKSFVRQYAALLELDAEEMVAELQRMLEPPPAVTESNAPDVPPIPEIHVPRLERWETVGDRRRIDWSSWLPSLALVVVVMLVCSGIYAFWQRTKHPTTTAQTRPPAVRTAPAPVAQTQVPATAPAPAPPVNPEPAQGPTGATGAPMNAKPETSAAAGPPQENEASRLANPNAPVRVELKADEPVWVLARADGKYIFSGTLEANQTRSVEANGAVTLRLGNAGGVNISLNGKPIGAVGPKGQVREVQLTSGGFHIVGAPKPSLPVENPI